MKAPDGDIQRVTILGNTERSVPRKYDDAPEHILFIPPFDSYEEMENCLISSIVDCSWVSRSFVFVLLQCVGSALIVNHLLSRTQKPQNKLHKAIIESLV